MSVNQITLTNNKTAQLQAITINQFKELLTSVYIYPLLNIGFYKGLIQIIESNCDNKDLIDLDKHLLAINFRYYNTSTTYKKINLDKKIEELKDITPLPLKTYNTDLFSVTCSVPTLKAEKEYINYILNLLKYNKQVTVDMLLIAEITKYVNKVIVNKEEISFDKPIKDKIRILSSFPASIITNIIQYIDEYKQQIQEVYKLSDTINLPSNIDLLLE